MPLTRVQAQAIIDVVVNDTLCYHRIQSIVRILPAGWKAGGLIRNSANALTDVELGIASVWGWWASYEHGSFPQSERTLHQCCDGICKATTAAILAHLNQLPFVSTADDGTGTIDAAHYATKVVMKQGGEYTFDWWMSLDIYNPILWRTADWLQFPHLFIMNKGTEFQYFEGFDNKG